jgi:hypothetical protein
VIGIRGLVASLGYGFVIGRFIKSPPVIFVGLTKINLGVANEVPVTKP